MIKDTVVFGNTRPFQLDTGYNEDQIREALVLQHPAAAQAKCTKTAKADGGFQWTFTEVAGTKG